MRILHTAFVLAVLFFTGKSYAQQITREQVDDTISKIPSFSMYEDNYIISGIPLHEGIHKETADAKYQISFKQLLTRKTLPLDSYLFLTTLKRLSGIFTPSPALLKRSILIRELASENRYTTVMTD